MKSLVGSVWPAVPTLVLGLLLVCGRGEAAPAGPLPAGLEGRAWEYTDLGGVRHTIDWQARDKGGVLVFFFDLQSRDSLLAMNFFDALFARASDFGLAVVGVEATGRQAAEVRTLLQSYTAVYRMPAFPVTADPNFAAAKLFESHGAPNVLLLGSDGGIVARRGVFDLATAVELTREVERLLRRREGFFSPALRELGLSAARERQLGARAAAQEGDVRAGVAALSWGDQLPAFDFTDAAGRVGRWEWRGEAVIRVAFFWSGSSPGYEDDLAYFQGLHARSGTEHLEIVAVESTGLGDGVVTEILMDFNRRRSALSFPVVSDPQGHLVGLFGAGDPLPQTFLVGGEGEILYRADGLDAGARRALAEKIDRAMRLAGFAPQQELREVPGGTAPEAGSAEAPSISRQMKLDESLRFNLSQGDYFFSNGQYERARLFYQRYLELEPASLHALVRLAQINDLLHDPVEALEFWESVLRIRPDHAEGRARLEELRRSGVR